MTKKQEFLILVRIFDVFDESAQIPGALVVSGTKFCKMSPNICGFSVWNSLHDTILVILG
jgi:hypothetical protein